MIDIFDKYVETVESTDPINNTGVINRVRGMLIESLGPQAVIGEVCQILLSRGNEPVFAEVVGLSGTTVQLMSYSDIQGIEIGCKVIATGSVLTVPVGNMLLGRVLDALGKATDGKEEISSERHYPVIASPPDPMKRKPIKD